MPTVPLSPLKSRSNSLDLIKWLAMLTMVIDHLRLVWPELSNLFIPGRLSFPLFCVAIAANVARSKRGELLTAANGRYLALMLVFAAISEVPYRYISSSGSFNVLVTLALGLVIAWGWQHRNLLSSAMALLAAAIAYVLDDPLMYGFYGALVPAAVLIAIKGPGVLWLLPAALCLMSNTRSSIVTKALDLEVYSLAGFEHRVRGAADRTLATASDLHLQGLAGAAMGILVLIRATLQLCKRYGC